jgi:BlaI family transcriptional regulator, penicillinase repressor
VARPRHEHPTPGELEILQILWDRGESTVRDVLEILQQRRPRAYTSIMSLMNVMADKGLLARQPLGKAFLYTAAAPREQTLGRMLGDLVNRAFDGSASALVAQLLAGTSREELEDIRRTIETFRKQKGAK